MKKKFVAMVMAMSMVFGLAACGQKTESTTTTPAESSTTESTDSSTTAQVGGTFKLGVSGPLTGDAAIYGQSVVNGAKIAVEEINAAGGAVQFEMQSQDDEADGEKSVNAYNTMMDWGMQVLVGPTTTGASIAVGSQAATDRVFMLTPSASSTDVIATGDNVFQVWLR
jgi:branched-chain amino acid transport system substrate-binding protein